MKTWEMPTLQLQGSDKQRKWAMDIIADIYATINANMRLLQEKQWPHAERWEEAFDKIISQVEGFLSKTNQAGAIIANREKFRSDRVLSLANKYVNFGK